MPVKVGVGVRLGKWSVLPSIAIAPSYNLGEKARLKNENTGEESVTKTSAGGNTPHQAISVFGLAAIDFAYNINSHLAITAGSSYSYMFTNMLVVPAYASFKATRRHYAFTGNLGVILSL